MTDKYIIKLYLDEGEKVNLGCESIEVAEQIVAEMKKNNEVFSVLRIEKDSTYTITWKTCTTMTKAKF